MTTTSRSDLPLPEELSRVERMETIADRLFRIALDLPNVEPTRDGLASLSVELRGLSTELTALRDDA